MTSQAAAAATTQAAETSASAANEAKVADLRAAESTPPADQQPASQPGHSVVAASGGSVTTSREPLGEWARSPDSQYAFAQAGKPTFSRTSYPKAIPAKVAKPAGVAPFAKVGMATRIPEMAKWIAARPNFTFAEAAAASAPSPCSPTVMAYTLPDPRLASALAELGFLMTAGGKNGYTVTVIGPRSS